MNGAAIERLLMANTRTRHSFRGVYPSDCLPNKIGSGTANAYVINLDRMDQPGSHWTALYVNPFGDAIYMDSFGLAPTLPAIKQFISENSRSITFNKVPIQSLVGWTCGLYCVYFIQKMCDGASLNAFIAEFKALQPQFNDRKIVRLFQAK